MTEAVILAIIIAAFLAFVMAAIWWIALRNERWGLIDAVWSFATGAACITAAAAPGGLIARKWLVGFMTAVWAIRLGSHLWARSHGAGDPRYAALKQEWGAKFRQRLFRFLQVQAFAAWPFVLAVFLASHAPSLELGWLDGVGAMILLIALVGESAADRQLKRFKANPANHGQICDQGLWSWSRHPNYFFEWLAWCGFALIALSWTLGWLSLLAPAWSYWLLNHASGVPHLEAHLARSRPQQFTKYCARVSRFWPRPPRVG